MPEYSAFIEFLLCTQLPNGTFYSQKPIGNIVLLLSTLAL